MIHLKDIINMTTILFFIGMVGLVLNRKNILITIMTIELMLLAVNINFITFSIHFDDLIGQVFVMFILTIAACESSIGLSILCTYNQKYTSIVLEDNMKKIINFT